MGKRVQEGWVSSSRNSKDQEGWSGAGVGRRGQEDTGEDRTLVTGQKGIG